MAEHETIADIIAWLRRPIEGENAYLTLWRDEIAARIEVALRRERGDAAKLREALKAIVGLCAGLMPTWDGAVGRIKDMAETALSAPPRNCDVGTAQEQSRRFDQVCSFRFTGNCAGCKNPLDDSAVNGVSDCALFWAQMPYDEEGGAK